MFNTKQKNHTLKTLTITTDDYGDNVLTYSPSTTVKMFISLITNANYTNNSTILTNCTYVGLADKGIFKKGDVIDNKLEVVFVNDDVKPLIVYLKEINNNGTNNS